MDLTPAQILAATRTRILDIAYELAMELIWVDDEDIIKEGGALCALMRVYNDQTSLLTSPERTHLLQGLINQGQLEF